MWVKLRLTLTMPLHRLIFPACLFIFSNAHTQESVLTQHNDLNRTGWYKQEAILNQNNVRAGSFGKIFSRSVDDQVYSQPLVVLNINIPGAGLKNVLFVASVNNTVYAFDADSVNHPAPYWQTNLTDLNSRPVVNSDMTGACGGLYHDFSGKMGIVGTPVIDTTTNTMYVVARSVNTSTSVFKQYLHALDITTGQERLNSPQLISASVNGTGDGNIAGVINFDPRKQNQRSGLLLVKGILYITWASHCDWGPYHGWVMGYDKTSLQQKYVYCSTPDGYNGGIWMSGSAPSADSAGNIYLGVGNGSVGSNTDPSDLRNRSESALKLTPSLAVSSFFTPSNYPDLEGADLDFGVTEMMLIPNTNLVMTACKDGRIYIMNRDNMGAYNASANNVVQIINLGVDAHLRSSFAYYKGLKKEFVYSWSENALLKAFPFDSITNSFNLLNTISSGVQGPTGNNGAFLAVSSNASEDSTAILWASYAANGDANQSVRPGILHAFDANDVTKELWNSSQYSTDVPGDYAKFNCPTICNGKVYLATFSNQVTVYGLIENSGANTCSSMDIALNKPAYASSVLAPDAQAGAAADGNLSTGWSSSAGGSQSIIINLRARYDLCKIILHWGADIGKDFTIDISEDSLSWTTLMAVTGNSNSDNFMQVKGSGRYVRMNGTASNNTTGYSLKEFEVYGQPSISNCGTPSGLNVTDIYEGSAVLHWNKNGASNFNIQYKTVAASSWNLFASDSNAISITGLSCATDYLFEVQGVCGGDSGVYSSSSSFSTLTCNSNCTPLPTRWSTQDIGDVSLAGSACFLNNVFTINASGTDIWDKQDGFRFAYKTLVGDGDVKARVVSIDQSDPWNKCGIMFRESLTPGSRHAFVALTSGNGVAFQNRQVTDDFSNSVSAGADIKYPYWIRLNKKGSVYTAYNSSDGNSWKQIGDPVNSGFGINIPVYAGIALTSHNNNVLSKATVDNYSFSGILDLELSDFIATLTINQTVELQWKTTLENSILNFVVERSKDNINYTDLVSVAAVNSGRFTHTYHSEDKNPLQGFGYYRLRITNLYGVISYSAPVFIRSGSFKSPLIYPNPVKGYAHIVRGEEKIRTVYLYDISGRILAVINNNDSDVVDLPVSSLRAGMYILKIKTLTRVYTEKLIVHN